MLGMRSALRVQVVVASVFTASAMTLKRSRNETQLASCSLTLMNQLSSEGCNSGAGFGCEENAVMYVDNGCRGVFSCNGKSLKCESYAHARTTCSCQVSEQAENAVPEAHALSKDHAEEVESKGSCNQWCKKEQCTWKVCSACDMCGPAPPAPAKGWVPLEGPMLATMPGMDRTKMIFAMDIDYPPYAYLKQAPYTSKFDLDEVIGVGADMMKGMAAHCKFDATIVQAHWSDCWTNGEIGAGLLQGWYHGCMTYTHATGTRNRYLDFTSSWAMPNKPAGLIVKLTDGKPTFDGYDNLNGRHIVDVTGWAPTADTLFFVKNQCTGEPFTGFQISQGDDIEPNDPTMSKGPNDRALLAVLEGKADAMWIYGDQAANYQCAEAGDEDGWNCDLWSGFGTTFAYVQSGMYGWMHNGTTIAMTKKGTGVAEYLDNCFESFRQTKEFYDVCKKNHHDHNQMSTCIPNEFFKGDPDFKEPDVHHMPFMFATKDNLGCSTGYCSCDAAAHHAEPSHTHPAESPDFTE